MRKRLMKNVTDAKLTNIKVMRLVEKANEKLRKEELSELKDRKRSLKQKCLRSQKMEVYEKKKRVMFERNWNMMKKERLTDTKEV